QTCGLSALLCRSSAMRGAVIPRSEGPTMPIVGSCQERDLRSPVPEASPRSKRRNRCATECSKGRRARGASVDLASPHVLGWLHGTLFHASHSERLVPGGVR